MLFHLSNFLLIQLLVVKISVGDHYKGGSISWKPTNPTLISGSTVDITITERHSWTFTRYPCNESTINSFGVYNDTQTSTPATLTCLNSLATCTAAAYTDINSPLYCTDFSTVFQISSGTYYTTQTLTINSAIDIGWRGVSWATETLTNAWSLVSHIDLTPIPGNKINTSPVTGSLPIVQVYIGQSTLIQILVGDVDTDQVVRCRWSRQYPIDECGDVCLNLPNAVLDAVDCFIKWTPVLRPEDIANGLNSSTYVVAITAEDFLNATSTTPLSSVPHQMLVYVTAAPTGLCSTGPSINSFSSRRNLACYGVNVGSSRTYDFVGTIGGATCVNDSIVDFISSSPLLTNKSPIVQTSNYSWTMAVTWSPNSNQIGLQPFCMAAVDNHGRTSSQYCVMIMVGGPTQSIYTPQFVQSTASPLGTVMSTQMRFSIQATLPLKRTLLNGTFINIIRMLPGGGTAGYRVIDCKYSPDVYFLNTTLVFYVTNPAWTLGATYYITMTQGVVTADAYCGIEAGSLGTNAWRFTIWDPSASSTTTPSTTTSTATTHTVTTRSMATTTYNTLYTTTGIPAFITTTSTSTTSTTSTSATSTTTTSATTTTTSTTTTTEYIPNADVVYPKDFEHECLQPITIATAVITAAIIPLHLYGMINLFAKMNSHFQQETLRLRSARRKGLSDRIEFENEEEETFV